jgi:hypothetical protein
MTATIRHQPDLEDDDGDYSELMPLDLGRFLGALERTPALEHGFGLHDVHKVDRAWEFLDTDCMSHGYLVELLGGRRLVLEVDQVDGETRDALSIEPLDAGAAPARRPEDERMAPWYEAHHITLHVAELKLLPPSDD